MAANQQAAFVLVAGAFHPPSTWDLLRQELRGHDIVIPALPTFGGADPSATHIDDAAVVSKAVETLVVQGKGVVLVGHSYAGIVCSEAARGLTKREKQQEGRPGGIIALVHLCSYIVRKGQTVMEILTNTKQPSFAVPDFDKGVGTVDEGLARRSLYNDICFEAASEAMATLRPHNLAAFSKALQHEPYADVPTTYIITLRDEALPLRVQDVMIDALDQDLVHVVEIDTGHSAMLKSPKELRLYFVILLHLRGHCLEAS